jgi:cell division septal protein FtsQ
MKSFLLSLLGFLPRRSNRRRGRGESRLAVNVPLSRRELRMRRRARNVRLVRWSGVAVAMLALGLYARSLWAQSFRGNAAFAVGQFEFRTNGGISAREVTAAAGLRPDMNLMDVDIAAIRARLLELPRVKQVHIERRLPDKFSIIIEERLPVARLISVMKERVVNIEQREALFVDRDGVAFKCEELLREYVALPVINAVDQSSITVGREVPSPGVKVALTLLEEFRTRPWAAPCSIRGIELINEWTISVETETGAQFVFHPLDLDSQLTRLSFILAKCRAAKKSVASVNLQLKRNVPVRFFENLTRETARGPEPGESAPLTEAESVSFTPAAPPRAREVRPTAKQRAEHDRQTILRGN